MEEMLSDMKLDEILSPEQISELIENVEHIADMEYEATGQSCIPNPLQSELETLQSKLKKEREEAESVQDNILGVVAHLGGVSRDQVYFSKQDKEVKCYPR